MFTLKMLMSEPHSADVCPLDSASMSRFCQQSLEKQCKTDLSDVGDVEISIQMLDDTDMRALNNQYRDKDSATNVLSFESGLPALAQPGVAPLLVLGDIVFCAEVIASEAQQQGKPVDQHWAHMLVHGTLHLCGYDHIESDEAASMEALEIQILSDSGIPNPYQVRPFQ